MNSKECLEILSTNYIYDGGTYQEVIEEITKIEQDLEILDILKNESDNKRIIVKNGIASFHLDMILTIDNYNKIKEWLENEN